MDLRGASADALAALTDELTASLSGGADAAKVGDDLFTVSQILRSEPSLRRVLTDVSVDNAAKQGLVGQIFDTLVSDATKSLLSTAVSRRWTATRDLADAIGRLSEIAIVRSAGSDSGRLADELFSFAQAVKDDGELRDALSNPSRSTEDKSTLISSLLDGKALPATITLAKQALGGTYRTVGVALNEYQQVAATVRDEGVAEVRVAQSLTDAEHRRLADALSRQYGREVHLNVVVDPDVIGGIKVEIGDDVIDGTVSSRLNEAARKLAG